MEDFIVEFVFGDIYACDGIDNKQKVLVTISSLVAQGMPQIKLHIESGHNVVLSPKEIVGAIVHQLPYVGFPKVLNALKACQKVFNEKGIAIDSE